MPFIGNLLYRVESQLINPDSGNDMTSGRVGQWEAYGGYYTDSDTVTKLFGGQVFTLEIGMGDNDISEFAPHNTYLDFLIAVGLLGTVILVGNMLFKCFILGYRTFIRDDKISFVFLLYSITWLVMGFNFDFFNSINYMVWYWL